MTRFLPLIAVLALALQSTDRDVGFVVCVSGKWDLALNEGTTAAVRPGRIVRDGDVLRKLEPDPDPTKAVVVAIYATGQKQSFTATTTMRIQPGTSWHDRILRLIHQRFATGFISASVRGGEKFEDAIVMWRDDRTDVAPVFAGVPNGSYQIEAYRIHAGHPASAAAARARVRWDGSAAALSALPPGLYQLAITASAPGSAGAAWLFVAAPATYVEATRTFDDLRHVDADAGADLREAGRLLGRGYLTVLDDETATR